MFSAAGIVALLLLDVLRPQEYVPALAGAPLLHVAAALAVLGYVVDLRLGVSRPRAAPQLKLVLAFFAWALVTTAIRNPDQLVSRASALFIPLAVFLLVAHTIQTFRMLQVLCGVMLALVIALSAFAIAQTAAPYGCHRMENVRGDVVPVHDGRPCVERRDCAEGGEPGAEYTCERAGALGTSTVHGRVRWRGTMEDPNELALALCATLPFAFAFVHRRRTAPRVLLAVAAAGLVGAATYFTQSRGGQLVFLTVLAVYFVHLVGVRRGLLVGVLLALPILILGGRGGADAEASTLERTECWWVGLHLFAQRPIFGVGFGEFREYHYLTAHNSFVLTAAELGLPGMLLWTAIVYSSVKVVLLAPRGDPAPVSRAWALALLSCIAGVIAGSMFLSYAYKNLLWMYVGLTSVLYQARARHDPRFRVRFGLRDAGAVLAIDAALLLAHVAYTGSKLGW
jgi:hypothetical protein